MLQRGAFLDVGTGVGWLAIDVARSWPAIRIVGIDPWEPALALAHANLAKSGVAERIELRSRCVEHLDDVATFTLAWVMPSFTRFRVRCPCQAKYRSLSKPLSEHQHVLIRDLVRYRICVVTRGSSYENRGDLTPAFFDQIRAGRDLAIQY